MPTKPSRRVQVPTPDHFYYIKKLGTGAFGEVYAVRKKDSHKKYALKLMAKSAQAKMSAHWKEYLRIEADVMAALNHPFLVNLNYCFQTPEAAFMVGVRSPCVCVEVQGAAGSLEIQGAAGCTAPTAQLLALRGAAAGFAPEGRLILPLAAAAGGRSGRRWRHDRIPAGGCGGSGGVVCGCCEGVGAGAVREWLRGH